MVISTPQLSKLVTSFISFRGIIQVGLLSFLLSLYVVLVVWMAGGTRDMVTSKSNFSSTPTKSYPVMILSQLPEESLPNSTLTFYQQPMDDSRQRSRPRTSPNTHDTNDDDSDVTPRTIMLVQEYNPFPDGGHKLSFKGCDYPCAPTDDSAKADLLILNAGRMGPTTVLPSHRKKNQVWLLSSREPPTFPRFRFLNRTDLRHQINWTRSVFSDATFPLTYGTLLQQTTTPDIRHDRDFDAVFESKRHAVAWFVGHCDTQSRREEYVRRMASRIDVHIYGLCGNMTCGVRGYSMGGYKNQCLRMLSENYKFYLAFENSFCENYVTEKFFNLFQSIGITPVDVVPVVRGGARYKRLFDPDIFVDADDFPSPEALADFLSELANDKSRYISMLKQKSKYTFGRPPGRFECAVCRALHIKDIPHQSYEDISFFWSHPTRCHQPMDLE